MLTSLAIIFITGLLFSRLFQKMKLPGLIGMIFAGILIGSNVFHLIDDSAFKLMDDSLLDIAPALRQFALVIILTRAGLSLDIKSLKKVGRPAILMCFVPACFEICGTILLAPRLLSVS